MVQYILQKQVKELHPYVVVKNNREERAKEKVNSKTTVSVLKQVYFPIKLVNLVKSKGKN